MLRTFISIVLIVLVLPGCITDHQPYLSGAVIEPEDLKPGDTALISVAVSDRFDIVREVRGLVMEDKSIVFHLHDNGTGGDVKAGDDIWAMKVDVPFNAPPGGFVFEISAYDENGNLVIVQDEHGEAVGMQTLITLEISYPEEGVGDDTETPAEEPSE